LAGGGEKLRTGVEECRWARNARGKAKGQTDWLERLVLEAV